MDTYIGIDPGGRGSFGWCVAQASSDQKFSILASGTCTEASQAVKAIAEIIENDPIAVGIDAPLYWVMTKERVVDQKIRKMVKNGGGHSATVGHVNALRGACLVQGVLSAVQLREHWPNVQITEAHPKALMAVWPPLAEALAKHDFTTEHERDAFIGAYAASYASALNTDWSNWVKKEESEVFFPSGFEVSYWFPNK